MFYVKNSVDPTDNGKAVPNKFELVLVEDLDYGLCLAGRNFSTGRIFALYKTCQACSKDLRISLPNLSLIELTKISDVHKSKDHNYYHSIAPVQKVKKNMIVQNIVLYGNKV